MTAKQSNNQLTLAFDSRLVGEAELIRGKGTEPVIAEHRTENPTDTDFREPVRPTEPPDAPKHVRWCDRESPREPTYVDS